MTWLKEIEPDFRLKFSKISDVDVVLITPPISDVEWTREKLIYRSSIWTMDQKPVSLSFPKFFNWGEKSDIVPECTDLGGTKIVSKIDGSALIVSQFSGQKIIRTRGSFSVDHLPNRDEIDIFRSTYPSAFDNDLINSGDATIIYEWVSPENQIIVKYENPDIYLVGGIKHDGHTLLSQEELDQLSSEWGVRRPEYHTFSSIPELLGAVSGWSGEEGVCLYYDGDQSIKKIKSLDYIKRHSFKQHLSEKAIVDMFLKWGRPTKEEFLDRVENEFDFECRKLAEEHIEPIYSSVKKVKDSVFEAYKKVTEVRDMERKDAATIIKGVFGGSPYSFIAFKLLDGSNIDGLLSNDNLYRKLLLENLN